MTIPIPNQKAGSCALPVLKIQVVIRSDHKYYRLKNKGQKSKRKVYSLLCLQNCVAVNADDNAWTYE